MKLEQCTRTEQRSVARASLGVASSAVLKTSGSCRPSRSSSSRTQSWETPVADAEISIAEACASGVNDVRGLRRTTSRGPGLYQRQQAPRQGAGPRAVRAAARDSGGQLTLALLFISETRQLRIDVDALSAAERSYLANALLRAAWSAALEETRILFADLLAGVD